MQSQTTTAIKNYPDRPITIIVPFSAGGGLDLMARSLEKMAPKYLGQPLVVVNKPGGAGTIGWNELVNASPDGYTIGISAIDVIIQPLYGSTKYHYPTALEPIAQIASLPQIMVTSAKQPYQNINALISYVKQHPEEVKCGIPGIGSPSHVLGEAFAKSAGISLKQVSFRGNSEVTAALLGGHVQIGFVSPAIVKEQIKSGALIALATTGEKRLVDSDLAQIPTFKEVGIDNIFNNWCGVVAPKELPPAIKARLEKGLKEMVADPEFQINAENLGLQVNYLNSEESKEKWSLDGETLSKTITETGILEQIKAQKN
ncbi:tripartite tricarboxylate transporter substrate binding protein [Massilibacillus massiliensis]